MWNAIKEMAGSKKFLAAVLSAVVWVAGRWGLKINAEELLPVVGPLWGYIFGQAAADWGKSAAKLTNGK